MNQRQSDLLIQELREFKAQKNTPSDPSKWWSFLIDIGFWWDLIKIIYKYLYK